MVRMSTPSQDLKVRPSPIWYVLVVVLWIGAVVVAFISFKPFVDLINDGIDSTPNNSPVTVTSDGFTVYSQGNASDRSCSLTGSGSDVTTLDSFDVDFTVDSTSSSNYTALASTPKSLPAGTYTLSCSGVGPKANLGIGDRLDVGALTKRAVFGVLVPLAMGFLGLVVLIVMLVRRHGSKSRIRNAKTQAATGYYPPGGGYPPASGQYPPPPGQYPPPPPA
jgi:hypothetical protein